MFQRIETLLASSPQTPAWKPVLPALLLAGASLLVHAAQTPVQAPVQAPMQAPGAAAGSDALAPALKPAAAAAAATDLAAAVLSAPAAGLLKVPTNARHVLVLEEGTGRVVIEKDAQAVVPIASLTKLMSAMVLLDARLDPNERLRIDSSDVDRLKHSASRVAVGAEMSRDAALRLALMSSDNRATAALARTYPGGSEAFMSAMRAKIRALGLKHTALVDPTGLSPDNRSTAVEVARIAAAAARYPEIARITSEKTASVPINGRARELRNTNRLVGNAGWDIGLSKTGYTDEAGRCLTLRMTSGGKQFTMVLLDAAGSAQRLGDAARIRKSLAKLPA